MISFAITIFKILVLSAIFAPIGSAIWSEIQRRRNVNGSRQSAFINLWIILLTVCLFSVYFFSKYGSEGSGDYRTIYIKEGWIFSQRDDGVFLEKDDSKARMFEANGQFKCDCFILKGEEIILGNKSNMASGMNYTLLENGSLRSLSEIDGSLNECVDFDVMFRRRHRYLFDNWKYTLVLLGVVYSISFIIYKKRKSLERVV